MSAPLIRNRHGALNCVEEGSSARKVGKMQAVTHSFEKYWRPACCWLT